MSKKQHYNKILDDYSFGKSKAEIALARILSEKKDPHLNKTITKMLVSISKHLRDVRFEDKKVKTRLFLFLILQKYYIEAVDRSWITKEEPKIASYLKNCIVRRLRVFLRNEFRPKDKKEK